MRAFLLILLICFFSCRENKAKKTIKLDKIDTASAIAKSFIINCTPPDIDRQIVHSDTTFRMENYDGHRIKSFDSKGRLVRLIETNLFESNSNNIYSFSTFYDSVGHIIYEDRVKGFSNKWHCYSYQYDNLGRLVSKSGYSSGEIGIKITYVYNGTALEKEIIERADGKKEIQH